MAQQLRTLLHDAISATVGTDADGAPEDAGGASGYVQRGSARFRDAIDRIEVCRRGSNLPTEEHDANPTSSTDPHVSKVIEKAAAPEPAVDIPACSGWKLFHFDPDTELEARSEAIRRHFVGISGGLFDPYGSSLP
jgi:hypothetical protein